LDVRAFEHIERLTVQTKKYSDDRVEIFPIVEAVLQPTWEDYTGVSSSTPLRLRIDVPGAARYAVHLVGYPVQEGQPLLITSVCRRVFETAHVSNVYLAPLLPELDVDGDTFPEDAMAFCASVAERGPCEESCLAASYRAMEDCNPADDYEVNGEGGTCGESPASTGWNPFVVDTCGDCHDTDCFAGDRPCSDGDGDGYAANVDCDDQNPAIHPDAEEICGNGIDENCGIDIEGCEADPPCDDDSDGYLRRVSDSCGSDCDDSDPAIHPGAPEGAGAAPGQPAAGCDDEVDNNCNGTINEGCFPDDYDSDGVPYPEDCNDCNPGVHPGRPEICGNALDDDCVDGDDTCSGSDLDGDGVEDGNDCDDSDGHFFPGAPDVCGDDLAQNCNIDRACTNDSDGDGYQANYGDCDDEDDTVHPWANERCDPAGIDEDCDDVVNEVTNDRTGCVYAAAQTQWVAVDFAQDVDHCGSCRYRCCPHEQACVGDRCWNGLCRCNRGASCAGSPANTCCGTAGCRDLTADIEHCGGCGRECVAGEECRPDNERLGACFCPFEADQTACNNAPGIACCSDTGCVNTNTEVGHCGNCGTNCRQGPRPAGNVCQGGTCMCTSSGTAQQCTAGRWCTGLNDDDPATPAEGACGCANLDIDEDHCGHCEIQCDPNETCQTGECRCGAGGPNCSGEEDSFCCPATGCVNRQNDENNCGTCGNVCDRGERCNDGRCECHRDCDDGDRCTEDQCNAVTNRCNHSPRDRDGDGYCHEDCCESGTCHSGCRRQADCDDGNAAINPGRSENCSNGWDDDCDGEVDGRDADCI
jgi:hypothetical protein